MLVMPALVAGIHAFLKDARLPGGGDFLKEAILPEGSKTWMAGTNPART
jgi:hypothetical protein